MKQKRKILLVDDSDFDRQILAEALTLKGNFEVIQANNEESCFEKLLNHRPNLVLLDILIPGTSGKGILRKIREKFNEIELPTIMVTSQIDALDVVDCLQCGANDYITKPVNFDIAISRISTHLKMTELSQAMSHLKEIAAINAIITTYNHEINNPLSIALSYLERMDSKNGKEDYEKLKTALWRISDIVKQIREMSEKKDIEFKKYTQSSLMVKVR